MKSVLVRLGEYGSGSAQISAAEAAVAHYVRKHPQEASDLSIHALAQCTYSSPSTVVRMCQRLGFDGYREFRRALQYELAVRDRGQDSSAGLRILREDSPETVAARVAAKNEAVLKNTVSLLDMAALRQSVELLAGARTVGLFGVDSSAEAVRDAGLKLLRLGRACVLGENSQSRLLQAKSLGPQDAALIFSCTGSEPELLECARLLKADGVPVISVTRFDSPELTAQSGCCLYTAAGDTTFFSAEMNCRIGQLTLVDILYAALAQLDYDRNAAGSD